MHPIKYRIWSHANYTRYNAGKEEQITFIYWFLKALSFTKLVMEKAEMRIQVGVVLSMNTLTIFDNQTNQVGLTNTVIPG